MLYNIENVSELRLQTSMMVMGKNIDLKLQTSDSDFEFGLGRLFLTWCGFILRTAGPWIDAAVTQGHDIIVVSKMETLYDSPGVLSGFGKEIHRLEWKHGYRYNPTTKMMVHPSQANGLPTKTLRSEYTHN
jgi:hypothetical protein